MSPPGFGQSASSSHRIAENPFSFSAYCIPSAKWEQHLRKNKPQQVLRSSGSWVSISAKRDHRGAAQRRSES